MYLPIVFRILHPLSKPVLGETAAFLYSCTARQRQCDDLCESKYKAENKRHMIDTQLSNESIRVKRNVKML